MKCQYCPNEATEHFTKVVKHQKQELHLCKACAAKHTGPVAELSLSAILHSLISQHVSAVSGELSLVKCPTVGIKSMEFRSDGRLGCPADYEVFRVGLLPILQRIHRATRQVGKVPRRLAPESRPAEVLKLRQQLLRAVDAE